MNVRGMVPAWPGIDGLRVDRAIAGPGGRLARCFGPVGGLAERNGELVGHDAEHLAHPVAGFLQLTAGFRRAQLAKVGMSDRVAGQGQPAVTQCAHPRPVQHQALETRRRVIRPASDHEGGGGNPMVAQHRHGVGEHAGQPVVEGQCELLLVRLGQHLGRGGEAPALIRRDLQVPLEVARADIVHPPLGRADRMIGENPAALSRGASRRDPSAGGQEGSLRAHPGPYRAAVGETVGPVLAQRVTNSIPFA